MNIDPAFSHDLTVNAVTDYFVHSDMQRSEPDVTPLKLQKLIYLAQANFLASTDRRLFDEPVEAFAHGPVVYKASRRYSGRQIIATREELLPAPGADEDVPADIRDFLDQVWLRYKDCSASELRNLTHRQAPWLDNYVQDEYRTEIPDQDMARYFRQNVPANERIFHSSIALVPAGFLEALDEDDIADKMRNFWS